MSSAPITLSAAFDEFFESERSAGYLLLACTAISLVIANSPAGAAYSEFWQLRAGPLSIQHWINDALMAVFFLLIGLELERELYAGELSGIRNALLPLMAALGGMAVPSLIHFWLNHGTATQPGIGIPIATDIAFALGILAMLGKRVPASLKVFLVAFAVIDDLGAIAVIALFYTATLSAWSLAGALAVWAALLLLNHKFRVMALAPYLIGGILMWVLMFNSGVHATVAGVLLAFAIPFRSNDSQTPSPSNRVEHALHKPTAFLILPLFALANTSVVVPADWITQALSQNSLGIGIGLVVGKPLGVMLLCFAAVKAGICELPADLRWGHLLGAGMLGGIGFTMSIFITNLAFPGEAGIINGSKMAILAASLISAAAGYVWLRRIENPAGEAQKHG